MSILILEVCFVHLEEDLGFEGSDGVGIELDVSVLVLDLFCVGVAVGTADTKLFEFMLE